MSIPNHILEQLSSQADLISIIGRHTTLKRAGIEYKGCCPFHGEKSPSFYVNPQKNIYHCFGCSVGGNAISFLRDYENLTFMEAVNELSKQTGIEVPKDEQKNVSYQRRKPQAKASPPSARAKPLSISVNQSATKTLSKAESTTPPEHDNDYSHYDNQETYNHSVSHADAHTDNMPAAIPYDSDYYANDYRDQALEWSTLHDHAPSLATNDDISAQDGNLYELLTQIQQFYH